MTGWSQKPARHRPLQHVAPVVQLMPIGSHACAVPASRAGTMGAPASGGEGGGAGGMGASQRPLVQLDAQQSAPVVHAPAAAVQRTTHVLPVGSQWPEQQSAFAVHVAF